MTHQLVLPQFTPTPLNRLMRGRRRDRIRLARGDRDLVAHYAREQEIPRAETPRRVSLVVTMPEGTRRPDPDSLWKSLLDALVEAGLLVNDSARWVELGTIKWDRGERQTTVSLENLRHDRNA